VTATLVACALLVGIFAGWVARGLRRAAADKVTTDERAHLEYLRERYEVQHTVQMGDSTITVDDPEQYIVKGAPRAEATSRRPRRG